MKSTTSLTLTLTLEECGLVHDALLSLPMRRVEALVTRLRAAAAEAVQAEKPKAAGCGGCQPKTPKEAADAPKPL